MNVGDMAVTRKVSALRAYIGLFPTGALRGIYAC